MDNEKNYGYFSSYKNPRKALVYAWNCYQTNYAAGSGGGGGDDPPFIEPVVILEITGPQGGEGPDGDDGTVEEEDNAPFMRPKESNFKEYKGDNALLNVSVNYDRTTDVDKFKIAIIDEDIKVVAIKVYDISGKLIYEDKNVVNGYTSKAMPKGVYMIIISHNSQTLVQKVLF